MSADEVLLRWVGGRAGAMDDVWFAPGLTRQDFERFLEALALRGQGRPPLLAVARGDVPELLMASRALFALFGATSDTALADRLLNGNDPGAQRLATLCQTLPLQGAPRLERLRFFMGPGSEIITFLCRRIPMDNGKPVFVAAALGVRPGLIPDTVPFGGAAPDPGTAVPAPVPSPTPIVPMNVPAILAALRTRYPSSRTVRFLWQTNADGLCTQITPQLAEVVGSATADLVGRSLVDLAPTIDPSGRLAQALASRTTWSGLDVAWPIADAPATAAVGLGAIPALDRDRGFEGYRGYGVIHLDRIASAEAVRFPALDADPPPSEPIPPEPIPPEPNNVLPFVSGVKTLSAEDQRAFETLRVELRDQAGLNDVELPPLIEAPVLVAAVLEAPTPTAGPAAVSRTDEVGRNAAAVFDRLATGLLVSRDSVPIFANRHLLDLLGFADEDALHAAGGMHHLFGGVPGHASGSESIGVRARDGTILPVNARMQSIEWDGLPATLLTLHPQLKSGPPPHTDEIRELRAILETATDGVAVMDAQCNVVSLNRSGEALFGCDRGTVIGKPFLSLFAPETQSLASDYLEGLKSNATKSLLNDGREILIKAHQGGTIPVFMTLGRLDAAQASGGVPAEARFCALFRDLTHAKKIEQELDDARQSAERASALKTDVLTKVSHELRTPLNAIIGFAEVIMDERFGPVGNERYKDYLRDIHASGTHVLSLVNDLLDLSKIEAGKMQLAEEAIDVNKIVNESVAMMQPQASRERVILRLSLAPLLPQIKADERSLRQIVLNLLSNAVKFNEPGGQVIIATAATDTGQVVIRIRDTGPGMSDEDIAAALEPFRQLSKERTTEGTGLGLPLTKALVEANQASLTIKSKLEHGTLVEVAFPPARVLTS